MPYLAAILEEDLIRNVFLENDFKMQVVRYLVDCVDLSLVIVYYNNIGPLVKPYKEDFSLQCFHPWSKILIFAHHYNDKCNWNPISSFIKDHQCIKKVLLQ